METVDVVVVAPPPVVDVVDPPEVVEVVVLDVVEVLGTVVVD